MLPFHGSESCSTSINDYNSCIGASAHFFPRTWLGSQSWSLRLRLSSLNSCAKTDSAGPKPSEGFTLNHNLRRFSLLKSRPSIRSTSNPDFPSSWQNQAVCGVQVRLCDETRFRNRDGRWTPWDTQYPVKQTVPREKARRGDSATAFKTSRATQISVILVSSVVQ